VWPEVNQEPGGRRLFCQLWCDNCTVLEIMAKPVRKQVQLVVVLAVLAVLALAARHFFLANGRPATVAANTTPRYVNPISQLPISSVSEIVNSPDRSSLAGSRVHLVGVRVQKVDGDGAFWIGRFGETLLIVHPPAGGVKAGERVDIRGILQPSYALDPAWLQKNLGIADTDTARRFRVYIRAENVMADSS
jgi:hypothetical protein